MRPNPTFTSINASAAANAKVARYQLRYTLIGFFKLIAWLIRSVVTCFLYNTYDAFYLYKIALRNTLRNKPPVIAKQPELATLNDKENKFKCLKFVLGNILIFVEKSGTMINVE